MDWRKAAKVKAQADVDWYIKEANSRAMTRAQNDMNKDGVKYIAEHTGHPNLANACFFEYDVNSDRLHVEITPDGSVLDGLFSSFSSYHRGSIGGWKSVTDNYNISRSDFWNGLRADPGDYGGVEGEWVMKNFWNGIKSVTNGWPKARSAVFLSVWEEPTISGYDVAQKYLSDYNESGRFVDYVRQEYNMLIRNS